MAASQAGQEAIYLREILRGFNFRQVGATEIWEDNASCIMMSENPANWERTRHVDTRVHYWRELVRDGHVKLLKCAGPQNVADALTEVEYPLLRACRSSAALRAAGLHTHVRTHRTSSDPTYLIKSGLLVHFREERNVSISGGSLLK